MPTADGDWRAEKRAAIDAVFDSARRGESSRHFSPSGRYELEIVSWEPPSGWRYSEGIVRSSDGESIAVIRRNYGQFPFAWCEDHPLNHDYLIAGEDYQGQTIIELDTARRADYLPGPAQRGHGFCWAKHHVAPDKTVLIVDGCVWACPYELVAFDFSQPMQLPYAELHRWAGDLAVVDGFDEGGTLSWTFDREVRLSDGKPYVDLTDEEEAALLDDAGKYLPGVLGSHTYRARWRAGDPFGSAEITLVEPTASE